MAIDIVTLALAKSYVNASLDGVGAIKGKNAIIKSIEDIIIDGQNAHKVTFEWTSNSGIKSNTIMTVYDGKTPIKDIDYKDGTDGVGIKSITKQSSVGLVDTYKIIFTNGKSTLFTVTNGKDGEELSEEQIQKALQDYLIKHPLDLSNYPTKLQMSQAIQTATNDMATNTSVDTKLTEYTKTVDLVDAYSKTEVDDKIKDFATKTYVDDSVSTKANITDVYAKTETYSQTEINELIKNLNKLEKKISDTVPTPDEAKENVLYLVKNDQGVYIQYIKIGNEVVELGSTETDLSDYYTKEQTNTELDKKVDKTSITQVLTNLSTETQIPSAKLLYDSLATKQLDIDKKVDKIDGKGLSTTDVTTEMVTKWNEVDNKVDNTTLTTELQKKQDTLDNIDTVTELSTSVDGEILLFKGKKISADVDLSAYAKTEDVEKDYQKKLTNIEVVDKLAESDEGKLLYDGDVVGDVIKEDLDKKQDKIVSMTKAEFDALTTKDPNTYYNVDMGKDQAVVATDDHIREIIGEYSSNLNVYTQTEQQIGTFLGKPLYRRVVDGLTVTIGAENGYTNIVDVSNFKIRQLINCTLRSGNSIINPTYYDATNGMFKVYTTAFGTTFVVTSVTFEYTSMND